MTTKNHTPIVTAAPANASTFNAPLGQLDSTIGDLATLTTTAKTDLVVAVNEIDATKQDTYTSQSANKIMASPDGSAGVPGFRSIANADLPASGAAAGIFAKVTVNVKGVVTSGSAAIGTADVSDIAAYPLDTLGATTDTTNRDASITAHGLLPKLANDVTKILSGVGTWIKWACGVKYNASGAYTPRSFINFTGAGVSVTDDLANDAVKVTISGIAGGTQSLATMTDVSLTSPVNLEALVFDQASALWKNQNISSIIPTGHVIQYEASNLTNRQALNLTGNGVVATDNAGSNRTDVTITTPVKASGAEVTTGTDDSKFATAKAIADAGIVGTAASLTAQGKIEIATDVETTTGTDATRAVSPSGLAGSIFGIKSYSVRILASDTDVDTTSGVYTGRMPSALNGMNLIRAQAYVDTAGTTNATTVQVRNMTKYSGNDALSTAISIASGGTVGTVGIVNASYDDVATDDELKISVTAQSTTKPKGLIVTLEFRLP